MLKLILATLSTVTVGLAFSTASHAANPQNFNSVGNGMIIQHHLDNIQTNNH